MPKEDDESPSPRLIPKMAFGAGTAILAGAMVVAVAPVPSAAHPGTERVMTTSSLGGAINAVAGPSVAQLTACCSPT